MDIFLLGSKLKEEYPDLKMTDLTKKLGEMWRGVAEDDKAPYAEKAVADKERYEREKEVWEKKQADLESEQSESSETSESESSS